MGGAQKELGQSLKRVPLSEKGCGQNCDGKCRECWTNNTRKKASVFFFSDMRCDFSAKLGSMTSNMCCFLLFSFAFCYI